MTPDQYNQLGVKARCPDCAGAIAVWDWKDAQREFGFLLQEARHSYAGTQFTRVQWRLLRCAGCGRAGLAKFHDNGGHPAVLESFFPRAVSVAPFPAGVPEGVQQEYREAELCVSIGAWRASSALVRSALEKLLKANGYSSGSLYDKIDNAFADGVITASRRQRAHDDVRVLGNEVVHDDWRIVTEDEVTQALHYVQRIVEDLYDDRPSVEKLLVKAQRLPPPAP